MSTARLDAVDRGIPRRLSAHSDDPHYDKAASRLSDRVAVILDGVELVEATSWDVDRGEVTRRLRKKEGGFVLDKDGLPARERLRGEVEVRWSKESAA